MLKTWTFFERDIRRAQLRDAFRYWIVIPAVVLVAGKALDLFLDLPSLPDGAGLAAVAGIMLAAGLLLIRRAMHDLKVLGEGTPNPARPPRRLVTGGSYGFCRHPMFLGYDLAACGVVLLCRSPGALLFSLPLFLLYEVIFLKREEKIMARRFRAEYHNYRHEVPFLLPLPFRHR